MGHLQRLLRGVEQNEAQIRELKLQLAAMERTLQNVQSENFGSTDESGGLFYRPGEIRIGTALKIDRKGITFAKGTTSPFQLKWRDTFAGVTRALISAFISEGGDTATMSLTVDGEGDWLERMTLQVRGTTRDGAWIKLESSVDAVGSIQFVVFFDESQHEALKLYGDHARFGDTILMRKLGDAVTEVLEYGQLWGKDGGFGNPTELWFTADDGIDQQITMAGTGGTHMIDEKDALTVGEAVTVTIV